MTNKQHNPLLFDTIQDANRYTPDFVSLKTGSYDEFPVFIFGTLQQFRVNNKIMGGCKFYGKARTYQDSFVARQPPSNRGGLISDPFIFNTSAYRPSWVRQKGYEDLLDVNKAHFLEGELYGVPLRKLTELDWHHSNTDGFVRDKIWVKLLDDIQEGASLQAYAYFVDLEFFADVYSPDCNLDYCRTIGYKSVKTDIISTNYIF